MSTPEPIRAGAKDPLPADRKQERVSIVDLRNGKVLFKQKPLSLEKQSETLQEIVKFRTMLEDRISKKEGPLSVFPEEHKPLIAKLAHESDKTLTALAKHIHHELLPSLDDDEDQEATSAVAEALPLNLVESAIQEVLVRNNYGLDVPFGVRAPASICVWRWEVRADLLGWLPKNSREKAEMRLAERVQAKEDLRLLLEALPQEERNAIIDPKGTNKLPAKELNKPDSLQSTNQTSDDPKAALQPSSKKEAKRKAEEPENDNVETQAGAGRPKKTVDPEKAAKEKEKLEKKAARAEKEKKEKEAHNKSQNMMARFFSMSKAKSPTKVSETAVAGPSRLQSDFEKVFKPFVLHKDKVMAPTNWFTEKRKQKRARSNPNNEVIVVDMEDEEDAEMQSLQPSEQVLETMSSQERLKSILALLPPAASPGSRPPRKPGFKVYNPISVRDLVSQLSEAEVSGNDEVVRSILLKLRDRELLPAKAFCFHEDARPGYFGTWTRNSRIIGSRTPFAKDTLIFDYGYDSGEEWEEEPAGEDVAEDGEEEEADDETAADSDLESWLVDDDEEPADLSTLSRNSSPPPLWDLPPVQPPKRKAEDPERKMGKKRKVVVPLVPFAKGPIYESVIGQCDYEPFRPYAIELFNDTPMCIDPFTFVSTCLEDYKESLKSVASSTNNPGAPAFVVPSLPPRLASNTDGAGVGVVDLSNSPSNGTLAPKKPPVAPKIPFPEAHMHLLLSKIMQLQASSITTLVEAIHLELREHSVRKNAIEAKIKEVGEKCKEKKVWIVKPTLLVCSFVGFASSD
ncbi:hypothetical protein CVT26_003430 [Gymnopilus dilepis]|uniref:Chromatin assembly factor 1 subunit A dimerization domain-containing protein n=1 Tax=Gymnopilus dilepis TaxID=231916 RepID=A0A409VQE3_9AGAR|nr:hypothetical protein CVT26_003430 [Gymnopilus dilepis]